MASFARRSLRPAWSVEEHALFAARKEYELLRLLSGDKKALATARRLGAFRQSQPHLPAVAAGGVQAAEREAPQGAPADAAGSLRDGHRAPRRAAARRAQQPAVQAAPAVASASVTSGSSAPAAGGTGLEGTAADSASAPRSARQRRSAVRSARSHARPVLTLYFQRWARYHACLQRDLRELDDLEELSGEGSVDAESEEPEPPVAKRGREPDSSSSSQAASSSSTASSFSLRIAHGDACEGCMEESDGRVAYCRSCATAKGWPQSHPLAPWPGDRRSVRASRPAKRGGGVRVGGSHVGALLQRFQ